MNTDLFWSKVKADGECWIWTRSVNSKGYGCFAIKGKSHLAHRLAYEAAYGPIPDGLSIDHVYERGCTSKRCVRPDHLEAVTAAENNRRAWMARHPIPHANPSAPTSRVTSEQLAASLRNMWTTSGAA